MHKNFTESENVSLFGVTTIEVTVEQLDKALGVQVNTTGRYTRKYNGVIWHSLDWAHTVRIPLHMRVVQVKRLVAVKLYISGLSQSYSASIKIST